MARGIPPPVSVDQVANAITHLGERGGSSLSAIRNVLKQEYSGVEMTSGQLKRLLMKGVQQGKLRLAASANGGRFVLKNLAQSNVVGRQARRSASGASKGAGYGRRRRRRYRRRRRRRRRRYRGRRRRRSGRRRRYRKRRRSRKTGRMYYRYY